MLRKSLASLSVFAALSMSVQSADAFFCLFGKLHCPPPLHHCAEGPPCIHRCCGCPKPICNPCMQPNWGYYQPCWTPWPWPQDWSHCPVTPPAAIVMPPGVHAGGEIIMPAEPEGLVQPRRLTP